MQPGKSSSAQLLDKFYQQYPNATAEQAQTFINSGKPPTAAEMKERDSHREIGVMDSLVTSAQSQIVDSFKSGPYVTGALGAVERGKETIGNLAGWTDETDAVLFHNKIDMLRTMAPRVFAHVGRVSNQELDRFERIVAGIGPGSTRQQTYDALALMQEVLRGLDPGEGGMRRSTDPTEQPGRQPMKEPKPGDVINGYRFKGGDKTKEENWEKRSEARPFRVAGNEKDGDGEGEDKGVKPPPSVWNWLNTDAPPGLLEELIKSGQIKPPPKRKV
jgi:hypothetical protein